MGAHGQNVIGRHESERPAEQGQLSMPGHQCSKGGGAFHLPPVLGIGRRTACTFIVSRENPKLTKHIACFVLG